MDLFNEFAARHLRRKGDRTLPKPVGAASREGVVRSGAAIHWFGGQNHELPDRCLRCLRFAPRSCAHRSCAVSSEGMDRRSRSPGSRLRAPDAGFATKPKLATRMIARAIAVSVPFKTVLAISNSNYARQAKAMYSGSAALMCFNPGASGDPSPARPWTCL